MIPSPRINRTIIALVNTLGYSICNIIMSGPYYRYEEDDIHEYDIHEYEYPYDENEVNEEIIRVGVGQTNSSEINFSGAPIGTGWNNSKIVIGKNYFLRVYFFKRSNTLFGAFLQEVQHSGRRFNVFPK